MNPLEKFGYAITTSHVTSEKIASLRDRLFHQGKAGQRCLLDDEEVAAIARQLRTELTEKGWLQANSIAIQAIAFDKTADTNWKVAWHQDLMFPFHKTVTTSAYALSCRKDGITYARPPLSVLEQMWAVRLHLDDCDTTNGPLRVIPSSHRRGLLSHDAIQQCREEQAEAYCLAQQGDLVLMNVLTLHASSQASSPRHRRVLHLVYYSGPPIEETWHRSI